MYANQTIRNKSFIKKYSHLKRFELAIQFINLEPNNYILDFGTGDGFLLTCLAKKNNTLNLYGYDPVTSMIDELATNIKKNDFKNITTTCDLETIASIKFDTICCLEVLEHFSRENQTQLLIQMKNLLAKNGRLLISVPIETGISSLVKNSIRVLLGQQHKNTSFKTVFKSIFSLKIDRNEENYIYTHIGFNHKILEIVFQENSLKIEKKYYSPFPYFLGFLNSQVYYILKLND